MDLAALLRITAEAVEDEASTLPADAAEAGRVFSASNEQALRAVATAINALLAQVQQAPPAAPTPSDPASGEPTTGAATVVTQQSAAGEGVMVQESAIEAIEEAARGGKGLIKVIDAGWGTSGYYGSDILRRDAGSTWPAGTMMYWDHPTADEAKARPERSLRDLAARTTEAARWMDDGPKGPGVYAPAAIVSTYRDSIDELKDDIGVSIRASARVRQGEAAGRRGPIIERLLPSPTNSIDFVTLAGRGGQVAALFEAARGRNVEDDTGDSDMGELQEAIARAEAAEQARDAALARATVAESAAAILAAGSVISEALRSTSLPDAARESVAARMAVNPPMKDGALDADALRAAVTEAAVAEQAYIDRLTGKGEVRGMGSGAPDAQQAPDMTAAFQRLGLSESAAKVAAAGR